jgi:hypothetical protein
MEAGVIQAALFHVSKGAVSGFEIRFNQPSNAFPQPPPSSTVIFLRLPPFLSQS